MLATCTEATTQPVAISGAVLFLAVLFIVSRPAHFGFFIIYNALKPHRKAVESAAADEAVELPERCVIELLPD